ncbi:hypothetical protein [Paraburkholderia sp. BL21I4N1]|uniref:hypothetical protein n=1 Tax=Paraburkholderia sp. BL21I4N1 TaxID=1938801 RepID=UPI000CFCA4EA|nr:hypothetical protein [Paraburkholderia sp. BL21I4N1]PQV51841.1 hypothetical protein B0G83_10450 [Paraburkholderia sp. BL21I4N1]
MIFTGKNLRLVQAGLIDALAEVHNRIATCPDVEEYAEDIAILEIDKADYEKLLARVAKAIEKEQAK